MPNQRLRTVLAGKRACRGAAKHQLAAPAVPSEYIRGTCPSDLSRIAEKYRDLSGRSVCMPHACVDDGQEHARMRPCLQADLPARASR